MQTASLLILIVGLLGLVPSVIQLKYYRNTGISDFLNFAILFLSISIGSFASVLALEIGSLIFFQLLFWFKAISAFIIFYEAMRILWDQSPRVLFYSVILWFIVLLITILFFQKIPNQPDRAKVLFINISHSYSDHFPDGAGLKTGDTYILSTRFPVLLIGFTLSSMILILIAFLRIQLVNPTPNIILAKRLWIGAAISGILYDCLSLPLVIEPQFTPLLLLFSLIFISVIQIFIPEAVLISQVQVTRVIAMYNQSNKKRKLHHGKSKNVVDYLDTVKKLKSSIEDQNDQ